MTSTEVVSLQPSKQLLSPGTQLVLRTLHITSDGDEFLVGDVARGEFASVPAIAITVIEALREGCTLDEAAKRVRSETGEHVDVVDFAATLLDLGFVAQLDGHQVDSADPELTEAGRLGTAAAWLARPFYSLPAFVLYGGLFTACLVALTAVPRLRPHVTQMFFLPNPVLSIAVLTAIGIPLTMTHELAHWIGARVNGVPARITLSRRYYMAVMETDLSALWALPRRRRFPSLLAGIAWDTVRLSVLLAARTAQLAGWWHPSSLAARIIIALIVSHVLMISYQFLVFLRTDIYAVLVTGLGCLNLTRISKLRMALRYRRLTTAETAELSTASPRDLAAARWYGWIQVGGLAVAIFYFFAFFAPLTVSITRWIIDGLTRNSPNAIQFWEILASSLVAFVPLVLPPLTYWRDRRRQTTARRHRRPVHRRRQQRQRLPQPVHPRDRHQRADRGRLQPGPARRGLHQGGPGQLPQRRHRPRTGRRARHEAAQS